MDLNGQEKNFLGQGWRYPMGVNGRGGIAMTKGGDDIDASIRVILATAKGERVMRPEFGSSIHDVVFAPNNPTTHGLIAFYVQEALNRWEPRIDVTGVNAQADIVEPGRVIVNIQYQVKATNDERNLVYPFYLIPLEE